MAKPIFIARIPAQQATDADIKRLLDASEEKMPDYYVFLVADYTIDTARFECFYEKDFNEVKYEELKALIQERMKIKM